MNDDDKSAYLRRLGVDAEPPSVEALFRLHRAQVENVPYETVWLHLGEPWTVEPTDSVDRVANHGRGGYCFHVNGAFSELLRALGYDVTRHLGGVHGPDGPDPESLANHLVLTVAGLPAEQNPEGIWYVDVGLGDALHEPLPLIAGTYQQGPFTYELAEISGPAGDWHFKHDASGSFAGMSFRSAPAEMVEFEAKHRHLSTSPDSLFVQYLIVQRRDADGIDIMVGLGHRRVERGGTAKVRVLTDRTEWFDTLRDTFGLRLDDADPEALDRLWEKTLAAHGAHQSKPQSAPQ
jgi:arylamine N-acetyltransferase